MIPPESAPDDTRSGELTSPTTQQLPATKWPLRATAVGGVVLVTVGLLVSAIALFRPAPSASGTGTPGSPNSAAAAALESLSAGPIMFEHVLHAGRYGAQNVGRGYLDVTSECVLDGSYVGPIYQVEVLRTGDRTWQRAYKQPTRMRSDWAEVSPLSGSVNSLIGSLVGSPTSILCDLPDLPLVLRDSGPEYSIDWDAVLSLVTDRRSSAMEQELTTAGWSPAQAAERVQSIGWELSEDLLVASRVRIEQASSGGGRIAVFDAAGVVLEEVLFWPADARPVAPPVAPLSEEQRASQAARAFGDPPGSA